MEAKTEIIARESLFLSSLPDDSVRSILAQATEQKFSHGETIFMQGDPAKAIYIVTKGWVKLYRVAANGSEAVVGIFTAGHSFGEALALRKETYPVSAEAVTNARLLRLPASVLTDLIKSDPEIALSILAVTYQHLHSLVFQIEQIKALSGAQRVAEFLVELCADGAGCCTVTLPYDKTLIAGRLGMKPESLSRAFARLRKQGVTVQHNHAEILDVKQLQSYAMGDDRALTAAG